MDDDNPQPLVTIGMLSEDLIRLASEITDEDWPDISAQKWYVKGIRDCAHLLILKWTPNQEQTEGTP